MTQTPYAPIAAPPATNGLGVAGFVISLIGLVLTGGILCPIGLIISLVALGREPKGFAIAGVIVGLLGSCGIILLFLLFGAAILAALGIAAGAIALAALAEPEKAEVTADMGVIAAHVERERDLTGRLPLDVTTLGLDPDFLMDPWGNPYRYQVAVDSDDFQILSNGTDGLPDTEDDISFDELDVMWGELGSVEVQADDDSGTVTVRIGGRTMTITGDEDKGSIVVDTGEKKIELSGDEHGGKIKVHPPDEPESGEPEGEAPQDPPPGGDGSKEP